MNLLLRVSLLDWNTAFTQAVRTPPTVATQSMLK